VALDIVTGTDVMINRRGQAATQSVTPLFLHDESRPLAVVFLTPFIAPLFFIIAPANKAAFTASESYLPARHFIS
jgi:hypothetical protein